MRTNQKSRQAFERAKRVIPGGVNSPVRSFLAVGGNPPFIRRGRKAFLYDLDGNRYLDFCMSWGALILGHAHPRVVRRARNILAHGTSFGAPTLLETRLAKIILESFPSMDQIRFVNSGTEAVMSAVRLARAFTRKDTIIKFDGCYHGHADHLLTAAGSGLAAVKDSSSSGVPRAFVRKTISIPFNDLAAVRKVFARHGRGIAAVLVEPVPANMGVVPPQNGFLRALRELTQKYHALLIFDEVISGFRLGRGGAQGLFHVRPDLTCLGKIIGGGFPVGAYGGRKNIMALLAPEGPVYQAGTLSGNPVAMAAGLTTLETLRHKNFYEDLNVKSAAFLEGLSKIARAAGLRVNALGSMFTVFFSDKPVENYEDAKKCDSKKFAAFHRSLLQEGIYLAPSPFEANFISSAHTQSDLERALESIQKAISK